MPLSRPRDVDMHESRDDSRARATQAGQDRLAGKRPASWRLSRGHPAPERTQSFKFPFKSFRHVLVQGMSDDGRSASAARWPERMPGATGHRPATMSLTPRHRL